MITKTRYNIVEEKAYCVLQESLSNELISFSTPLFQICYAYGIELHSYSTDARCRTFIELGIEGYFYVSENSPHIFYNDIHGNIGRIRYTIAHELGHFFLKHDLLEDGEILTDIVEQEAQVFAAHLLIPNPALIALRKKHPLDMCDRLLQNLFNVSNSCSIARLDVMYRNDFSCIINEVSCYQSYARLLNSSQGQAIFKNALK